MSDRIVVMFDGVVSQYGAPPTIYGRPESRQVADFVGLSNFISGRNASRQGETRRCVETPVGKLQCVCQRHLGARKRRAAGVPAGSGRAVERTPVGRHQSVPRPRFASATISATQRTTA